MASKLAKTYKLSEVRANRPKKPEREPFRMEITDELTVTIGDPMRMSLAQMAKVESAGTREALRLLVGDVFADELLALDDFLVEDWQALMEAWRKHYDLGAPGESPASSTS